MRPILQGRHVSKYFGKLAAIKDLDFDIYPGEIFGIAGPNGAGKSTLFNVITNVPYSLTSGKVLFEDKNITGLAPYRIYQMGIARTFQVPAFFPALTVLENVMIGAYCGNPYKITRMLRHDENLKDESIKTLEYMGLMEKQDEISANLSLFDKKRLMMASALIAKPRLLLLDEPMSGLNAVEIKQLMDLIERINRERSITILLIEHIMKALVDVCTRIMILDHGRKICEGAPEEVVHDERVIKSYLGENI
jgi:branched-chain amino acid transport system ATP-binding protein